MGEFDFAGELEKLDDWKMPEMRGGAHCGNGCAPPFASINHGGGVSTRAARHVQGFGSSGVPGGEGKRAAFTVLTSIRAKRRQAHERKEADMDESEKRRTMRGGGAQGDLSPHDEGTGRSPRGSRAIVWSRR